MKKVQQLHLWLGTLFAPLIIFFSLTGALQTFGLHEKSGTPAWLQSLAQVHKNQRLAAEGPPGEGPPAEGPPGESPSGGARRARPSAATGQSAAGEKEKPKGGSEAEKPEGERGGEASRGPSPLPLKIFVTLMAVGLITTTLLGIWMAFKYSRDKRIVWALLVLGTVLPVALLYI